MHHKTRPIPHILTSLFIDSSVSTLSGPKGSGFGLPPVEDPVYEDRRLSTTLLCSTQWSVGVME
jgi:hypothetical protein